VTYPANSDLSTYSSRLSRKLRRNSEMPNSRGYNNVMVEKAYSNSAIPNCGGGMRLDASRNSAKPNDSKLGAHRSKSLTAKNAGTAAELDRSTGETNLETNVRGSYSSSVAFAERGCVVLHDIVEFLEEFGIWGLAIHSFADAIIFPIPAFFSQVSFSMVDPSAAIWLATVGYIACLIGTPFGYLIGRTVGHSIITKLLKKNWVESANTMFRNKGEMAILIGSFTPIPFKVFTILSGSFNYPLWRLMLYASIGRAAKFYVVGILFYVYGRAAEGMVGQVSYYLLAAIVPVALLFLLAKRWMAKRKSKENKVEDRITQ
jgi:membrane protein YqaA with SNARE-associated domain